ncbi:16S rRNA (guanine(966)-N(2))-methyltransferase RsmD [Paraburkholderia sp. UYCP14C]|uniref:16S rRNA (guanine(966)-N(2))-methyltransferase RsmD n=1 Tax=Paraburkholderia sp. UYCP14C TaxID=2511130 RepID=UPI0010224814|nr:16S rRNA (guanine(966)-N(2))-methyltransferase RsmD [Paraburkholderia sp. UYCP14C]RZF25913.1 16S rRNA (guanine(966)-N(2))-methyltransferase RsmD [Paraburkholderia sp. UYCP14C]
MPRLAPSRAAGASSKSGKPHAIRIIGGDWKRTPLPVLDLDGLRPTPDRVRETLFNWLGQRLDGQHCLDLFAGSGALGFEAASRGAARVLMVERHARAAGQLRANQQRLDARMIEIAEADGLRLAASLAPGSFDVVFLDPPFNADLLGKALAVAVPLLRAGGYLYVEAGEALEPAAHEPLAGWEVVRQGKAGAVHFHLLQRENKE